MRTGELSIADEPLLPPPPPSRYDTFLQRLRADPVLAHRIAIIAPIFVTVLAAFLRLWNLAHPHDLMNSFDETYYVKDAWTLVNLGYEGGWGDDANTKFLAGDVNSFLTSPGFVVHPPLGKWIIGLGMLILGPETGWGWRITTALIGTGAVLLLYFIAKKLTGSVAVATIAGFLFAIDGLAIVMSRVAVLDNSLMGFILLGFWFILLDRERTVARIAQAAATRAETGSAPSWGPMLWGRPWVIAAGAAFGAASAVKWSGVWVLAGFGIYLVISDALARRRAGVVFWPMDAARQALVTFVLLVPVAFVVYLASWTGWLVSDGGYDRHSADANPATGFWSWVPLSLQSLWQFHQAMYASASGIVSPHPYASPAWEWPLLLRPVSMYSTITPSGEGGCGATNGCIQNIYSMPNPLIWWGGVAAVVYLAYRWFRTQDWRYALIITGVAVTYVPWLFFPERTIFQFYTIVILPFMILALAIALRQIAGGFTTDRHRRTSGQRVVLIFLIVVTVLSIFWYPVITATSVPYDFWRLHNWIQGWV